MINLDLLVLPIKCNRPRRGINLSSDIRALSNRVTVLVNLEKSQIIGERVN